MKKLAILFSILSVSILGLTCKKSDQTIPAVSKGKLGIYFYPSSYFFHVIAVPLRVYVDGQLKDSWDGTNTTLDCYGRQVDILIALDEGQHSVSFVAPDGHYVDGTATIVNAQCNYVSLNEDQFSTSKTNYGTNNGAITFYRTDLLISHTNVYVDNNLIGDIRFTPYHTICGLDASPRNLIVSLAPGVHQYKAIEPSDNTIWTGFINVQPNQCYNVLFHH